MFNLTSQIFFIVFLTAFFIFIIGVIFLLQGPPYVPTDDKTLQDFLTIIKKRKKKKIIDLGSGDGKIVIALAKAGYEVTGVEINPLLVYKSRKLIQKYGLQKKATIRWRNFWGANISEYDTIIIYGIKHIMKKLGNKLNKNAKKNTLILTNFFVFPGWKEIGKKNKVRVYIKR